MTAPSVPSMLGHGPFQVLQQALSLLIVASLAKFMNTALLLLGPLLQLVLVVHSFIALTITIGAWPLSLVVTLTTWFIAFAFSPFTIAFTAGFVAFTVSPFPVALTTRFIALPVTAGFIPLSIAFDVAFFPFAVTFSFLVATGPVLGKQQ